ncbi:MAG: zinc-dependent peptidase [candidate division KSB1 bacterium]|nr:zinc-dependent peptidase [candidate division KSB1 bacterium]
MLPFKKYRRRKLMNKPFPVEWLTILQRNVPYYRRLSVSEQKELQGLIQIFIAEKQFEGCGGLQITDEIKVTIAAQACMLLLGRETDIYPTLRSILVYPSAYLAPTKYIEGDLLVTETLEARAGESWSHGYVVLSWDEVLKGASDVHDGHNLVFHEFAHQLDEETGRADGAPVLPHRSMHIAWARVLSREYNQLIKSIELNRPTFLNQYGAISPAEFFAVVTEFFFEKPVELKQHHPALYEQLQLFYYQDPASRKTGQ